MKDSIVIKFQTIVEWYSKNKPEETRTLIKQGNARKIAEVQQFIDKKLPEEFIELYASFNGEEGPGMGIFLGHSFLSLEDIIQTIEISKTFVKPENRLIDHPAESERMIKAIIGEYKKSLPKDTPWYKFEFMCAPKTLQLPYFYPDQNTTDRQKQMFDLDDVAQQNVNELTEQLHELEKVAYNWDELHATVFNDGDHHVKRQDFSFIADIPFTSFPEGAIKKKYFNPNWVPIIFDNLGNYIGIDLDPDENGTVGQIIVFGRDEEDMFVIADSFHRFLDFNLELIKKNPDELLGGQHIHDIYKRIIMGQPT
ncbi:MAG: SMI1/KNR4 family protein [Chryseolinea sp.]